LIFATFEHGLTVVTLVIVVTWL